MLRLAHTQNFLALAPSKEQVARQPAMEIIPLVMEPESRFYADPVIVLDFQSLYPSMIIAYNLCYSTCIGRVAHAAAPADKPIRLGCSEYALPHGEAWGPVCECRGGADVAISMPVPMATQRPNTPAQGLRHAGPWAVRFPSAIHAALAFPQTAPLPTPLPRNAAGGWLAPLRPPHLAQRHRLCPALEAARRAAAPAV